MAEWQDRLQRRYPELEAAFEWRRPGAGTRLHDPGLELARALGNFRGAGGESGNLSMVERQRRAGPPDEGRHFERSRAAVGDTLDRERLERAWPAGQALSSEQAVRYALAPQIGGGPL